ncbi:chorismate-binding protein [Neisseria sp.]|uniref:bifunctional chorismate-binding protein/class IV aminotransferase n=1 Tax=Neisseria sp. TaxID=192066 RepID=UPI0035A168E2
MCYFAFFDDAVSGGAVLYSGYVRSDFLLADGLDALDGLLRRGWAEGLYAAVWTDYGFGLPLVNLPQTETGHLAVHWFADRENVDAESWLAQYSDGLPAGISRPEFSVSEEEYINVVNEIHEAIRRGNTYQTNYTARLHLTAYGSPVQLYRRLRQPVPYAALACLPDAAGKVRWTLCFSPELFVRIGSDGLMVTEPMKGTAPFLNDGGDAERACALQNDPKNRSENVMIADLLRNDLGKIAETGGVRVPEPFKVTRFGSVWQMTSAVEARAKRGTTAADVFRAAFPCGSVTGAPKRMSMKIINDLETEPRGLYCGSIGFLRPSENALGFEGVLNVVIRTLVLEADEAEPEGGKHCGSGNGGHSDGQNAANACEPVSKPVGKDGISVSRQTLPHSGRAFPRPAEGRCATRQTAAAKTPGNLIYRGVYGVGSGIVIDSDPRSEYEECGWKARFLTRLSPEFGIFETMRAEQGGCVLFHRHAGRLKTAAAALNLPWSENFLQQIQDYISALPQGAFRIKALLGSDGLCLSHAVLTPMPSENAVVLSDTVLPKRDYLRRFKTTRRGIFDAVWQQAERQGAFDGLLFDSDGLLLEGGRSNVFMKINGVWCTPPLKADILNGVMRQEVMAEPQKYLGTEQVYEREITREMVGNAEEIRLSNALRGIFTVRLK